jgi:hypothetical protein
VSPGAPTAVRQPYSPRLLCNDRGYIAAVAANGSDRNPGAVPDYTPSHSRPAAVSGSLKNCSGSAIGRPIGPAQTSNARLVEQIFLHRHPNRALFVCSDNNRHCRPMQFGLGTSRIRSFSWRRLSGRRCLLDVRVISWQCRARRVSQGHRALAQRFVSHFMTNSFPVGGLSIAPSGLPLPNAHPSGWPAPERSNSRRGCF